MMCPAFHTEHAPASDVAFTPIYDYQYILWYLLKLVSNRVDVFKNIVVILNDCLLCQEPELNRASCIIGIKITIIKNSQLSSNRITLASFW